MLGLGGEEHLGYNPSPSRRDFDNAGMPVMELLFHRFASSEAEGQDLEAQAVALRCAAEGIHLDTSESEELEQTGSWLRVVIPALPSNKMTRG